MSYNILVYGSLLDRDELESVFETASDCIPVKVLGYQRTYNQSATWREGPDGERGVLTAFPNEEEWMNAVLIQDVSEQQFQDYEEREQGYYIQTVPETKIVPYDDGEVVNQNAKIAVGKLWLHSVSPIPSYEQLCLEGASTWSEEFYTDFVLTTETSVSKPSLDIDLTAGFELEKFDNLEPK